MSVRNEIVELQKNVAKEIVGQTEIVERLVVGLLANGNLLVEGLPGLAKTRAIKALSRNIEGSFSRIQFTPDLLAHDITGREVPYEADGKTMFRFEKGPIFANVVLADEVNRAPAKVQNSLLEAMEERQVTVSGQTHKVPDLFMVMATQNPSTQHGTFPLPEAQMDRFLMHVSVDYPDEEAEAEIIRLVRKEQRTGKGPKEPKKKEEPRYVLKQETVFAARSEIDEIHVPAHVEEYIVTLIFATRYPQRYTYELKSFISTGASPRGTLAMDRCARVLAWLQGEDTVTIEHIRSVLKPVLRHRLCLSERAAHHKVTSDELLDEILKLAPTPASGTSVPTSGSPEKKR